MAYDARQRRIIAHALALTGSAAAAVRWLHENSVEVPEISESSIRRYLKMAEVTELVAEESAAIRAAAVAASQEAARQTALRDLHGSFYERMASMEATGWEMFERLRIEIEKPETDKRELLQFWMKIQEYVQRLRANATPAISTLWQVELMLQAYRDILQAEYSAGAAEKIGRKVSERYQKLVAIEQAKKADNGDGGNGKA